MDRLNAMRVFARVIDEGSFAGAARKFNLSPAVVTRLVAELEEHLGVRLINRTTRRIALTDAGESYLDRVRQILADVEDAEAQASAATSEPRGHLRVLMPVVVCASPAYLDRRGRPCLPNDLAEHDVMIPPSVRELNFQPRGGAGGEPGGEGVRLGLLRPALSTTHVDTMYAAALAGLAIAGLPSFVVADALRGRALERVLSDWHMLTTTLYAAMPTRKHVPARTRALVDFLIETFDGQGGTLDPWLRAAG